MGSRLDDSALTNKLLLCLCLSSMFSGTVSLINFFNATTLRSSIAQPIEDARKVSQELKESLLTIQDADEKSDDKLGDKLTALESSNQKLLASFEASSQKTLTSFDALSERFKVLEQKPYEVHYVTQENIECKGFLSVNCRKGSRREEVNH
jgi:flagellar motility protein MotE (MotC chaperone)